MHIRIDTQGRMVLPRHVRDEISTTPGEVLATRTPEGLLLSPVTKPGTVEDGPDGLPVIRLGRPVTNDEVLDALDRERSER